MIAVQKFSVLRMGGYHFGVLRPQKEAATGAKRDTLFAIEGTALAEE